MLEQPVPEGLHSMEATHTGAVHEVLQLVEGLTLENFVENCFP